MEKKKGKVNGVLQRWGRSGGSFKMVSQGRPLSDCEIYRDLKKMWDNQGNICGKSIPDRGREPE